MSERVKVISQKQIWSEYGYQRYLEVFSKYMDITEVSVIPFTTEISPDINFIPDLVLGSTRLISIARSMGWPTFESFDPVDFKLFPKELWLNGGGWETTVGEFKETGQFFVKPFTEKLFNAGVIDGLLPINSQLQTTKSMDEMVDEKIWVARPNYSMNSEYRLFVVGGEIVTGSKYKQNGVGYYSMISSSLINTFKAFLGEIPNISAVVDIVDLGNELKIVELNNFNSSAVYRCDYDALARALSIYLK